MSVCLYTTPLIPSSYCLLHADWSYLVFVNLPCLFKSSSLSWSVHYVCASSPCVTFSLVFVFFFFSKTLPWTCSASVSQSVLPGSVHSCSFSHLAHSLTLPAAGPLCYTAIKTITHTPVTLLNCNQVNHLTPVSHWLYASRSSSVLYAPYWIVLHLHAKLSSTYLWLAYPLLTLFASDLSVSS